ncbi:MAG: ABC transporter substrate-binding protein, partial [Oscillospiraceae bacterium]|nr:ABC transporter substrate-binding protein [Oscillospiraceae bacterium]
ALLLTACAARADAPRGAPEPVGSMPLAYAEQFTVDYYDGGAALVTIAGEERFLLVPDGADAPDVEGAAVLHTPLDHLYLASSGAMDPFVKLGALDAVRFTSTAAGDWSLPEVTDALDAGDLLYAGKYRAPDYELLLSEGCTLALENTMLLHSPATREQLEALGIPVLIERSSYEAHPLGRMEWIKLYALLVGREAEAEAFFEREAAALAPILDAEPTGKTAAFFYWNPVGYVNVRRPGDYVAKMIALAGGVYVPSDVEAGAASMNMQLEAFYAAARDADVLIYNNNIYPVEDVAALVAANALFADFKAVRTGNVWATEQNLFQETSAVGGVIADLHAVLNGTDAEELTYLHKLNGKKAG